MKRSAVDFAPCSARLPSSGYVHTAVAGPTRKDDTNTKAQTFRVVMEVSNIQSIFVFKRARLSRSEALLGYSSKRREGEQVDVGLENCGARS